MMTRKLCILFSIVASPLLEAQPYVDILNVNSQLYHSEFTDSLSGNSRIFHGTFFGIDNNVSITTPYKLTPRCSLIVKPQFEDLHFQVTGPMVNMTSRYFMFGLPVGLQFINKNSNWKLLVMGIPRYCIQHSEMNSYGVQYGGMALATWIISPDLKVKGGLYYNREFFGNFFVPLAGIDWKISDRLALFGVLPNNMRFEYAANKVIHFGAAYKNYQRSYVNYTFLSDSISLQHKNGYSRMKESEVKLYADVYVTPVLAIFVDAGYCLKYSNELSVPENNFAFGLMEQFMSKKIANGAVFTIGLAYRAFPDIKPDNHPQTDQQP